MPSPYAVTCLARVKIGKVPFHLLAAQSCQPRQAAGNLGPPIHILLKGLGQLKRSAELVRHEPDLAPPVPAASSREVTRPHGEKRRFHAPSALG